MKKKLRAALALMMIACLLTACGGKESSAPESEEPSSSSSDAPERELVVYSALPDDITKAAIDGYTEMTGLPARVISDSAGKLVERIGTGAEPQADVLLGVGAELVVQCADLFEPYASPEAEAIDPRFAAADSLYTPVTPMPIVIMYNKQLTTKAPAGWSTLAGSAYAGGVAFANPEYSGTSYTALCAMALAAGKDSQPDYALVEQFATNLDGEMMEGISDVYASVAAGKFAAGITLEASVQKYLNAGYDEVVGIAIPEEGTPIALEVVALVKNATFPDDARLLIDYICSQAFQQKMMEDFGLRTVRTDTEDPRYYEKRDTLTFSPLTPAQAVPMRDEVMARFIAGEAKGHGAASTAADASGAASASAGASGASSASASPAA